MFVNLSFKFFFIKVSFFTARRVSHIAWTMLWQDVCPSVRLFGTPVFETVIYILKFFHHRVAPPL